ncbi:ATP-binding protein [Metabacillus sp. HB246100]|uniref:ATP-binding protein n=1 Tax=Bacillus weihaiensis TaxID=1547283 RepID=UPI00235719C8|nr:ATP-binding protein [Bacillus weihaiensis]
MLYELLLNLLFILVGIFLQHLWAEKTGNDHSKIVITVVTAVTIILCILLQLDQSFIQDLKFIPFIIGSLYGGIFVSILLFFIMLLVYLFVYGLTSTIVPLFLIFGSVGLACGLLSSRFYKWTMTKKIQAMVAFACLVPLFMFFFMNNHQIDSYHTLFLLITPVIAMIIVGYIMEAMRETVSLRQQIIKAEKSEVVSQLAASVSHEVRNPLTVTKGFLQLVLESEDLPLEKRKEYIRLALEELDTASNIINDYLTFAKPAPAYWELLDIGIHLKHIEDIISTYAHMNSVRIESELVSCVIQGNKQQFHQCFLNITKNCIEAMPDGGVLTIYTSIFQKHVLIQISDTGIGMTKEQLNRIGEPYFSTKEKGTGLGMMVVYSIIKAMKGTITIQSNLGQGTTFTIRIPIAVPR